MTCSNGKRLHSWQAWYSVELQGVFVGYKRECFMLNCDAVETVDNLIPSPAEKIYSGLRIKNKAYAFVNGNPLDLRLDLRNHSPDGVEWGYDGSGPHQLALAVTADALVWNDERTLKVYRGVAVAFFTRNTNLSWAVGEGEVLDIIKLVEAAKVD
jgi:hypothetical protein